MNTYAQIIALLWPARTKATPVKNALFVNEIEKKHGEGLVDVLLLCVSLLVKKNIYPLPIFLTHFV